MRRSCIRSTGRYLLLVVLVACGVPMAMSKPAAAEEVRQAIERAVARWSEAFNRGDPAAVAALYTDDAILMPPDRDIIRGQQGVQDFWHDAIQAGLKDPFFTIVDVQASGDTAYEIGTFSLTVPTKDQGPKVLSGKYVVVWQRQANGAWKLHVDIWNGRKPAQ